VEWAERAEAWAQRPEGGGGELEVSRWSSVEPTGRPNFPAEGVGWRTETAEWRATEQTARWRQTTEWRSSSGTHGWRSTTEAWHTGAGAENFRPPTDQPVRDQLAISGTAWPTPGTDATPGADAQPGEGGEISRSWPPADAPTTQNGSTGGVTWQRFTDGTPPWEASNGTPPWEATNGTPPWEAGNGAAPREAGNGARPWETGNGARPWETGNGARPWETRNGTAPGEAANGTAPWDGGGRPGDGARHVETGGTPPAHSSGEGRPAWQQFAAPAAPWEQQRSGPSWEQTPGPPSARRSGADDRPEGSWQQLIEPPPGRSRGAAPPETGAPGRAERPGWQSFAEPDDGRHLVREDDRARWRRDAAAGMAGPGEGTRQIGRRRAPDPDGRANGGTGWSTRSDSDNWAGHTDTGSIQMFDDAGANGSSWSARTEAPRWRDDARTDDPPRSGGDWRTRTDGWRAEPDSGSWSRGDEPRSDSWRRQDDRDTPGWLREEREAADGPGESTGRRRRRREDEPPADPWAHSAADTGVIPMAWQQPETDTGSWRTDTGFTRPTNPNRRRDDEVDPRGGRRRDEPETRAGRRRASGDELVDPALWHRDSEAASIRGNWPDEDEARRNRWAPDEPRTGGPLAIEGPRGAVRDDEPRGRWEDEQRGRWEDEPRGRRAGPEEARSARWAEDEPRGARWTEDEPRGARWTEDEPRRARWADDPEPDDRRGGARAAGWAGEDRPAGRWAAEPPREIEAPRAANWSGANGADDWRRDLRDDPPPGDAVTEIRTPVDPEAWRRPDAGPPARGTARYRAASTDDWRRELAAQSTELAEGESRRFGTQEFVPFRPSGSAAVPTSAPVAEPLIERPVNGSRQELLVGNDIPGAPADSPQQQQWPPRQPTGYQSPAAGGAYERRPVGTSLADAPARPSNLLEPDDEDLEEETGGPMAAVGYTVMWYGVPVVLVVLYMLVLNGSQQATALDTLAGAAPEFFLSLLLSMVVAVGLRWASGTWKAASVGLAAAVMGGGLATVLSSAITGNSLS
jgi:hypothetical protein